MLPILRRYGTLIGFAALILAFAILLPDTFLTGRNWLNITQQMSMLAVVAFAMTIVMALGDFDLSVGSMASLAGSWQRCCSSSPAQCRLASPARCWRGWRAG